MKQNYNFKIYVVGGYVRDKLLGIDVKDIDFCFVIDSMEEELNKIDIEEGFKMMKNYLIGEEFKIYLETPSMLTLRAKFPVNDKYKEYKDMTADFVLARKEIYDNSNSRIPIVKIGCLEDDLKRRDFTINAMAFDMNNNLIDLFNGKDDLKNKILRTPVDPMITLSEDPLRVIRAIRFSITKDVYFHDELLYAIMNDDIIDKLFNIISKDRIREELQKMFWYSTVKSIEILKRINDKIPNFMDRLFNEEMWLKPTFEKKIKK